MSQNNNHLFLFTISPVQPFIASARKTRDLYAGSLILSKMTKEAAEEAVNQGLTLVFPNTTKGKSFPNRFMAKMGGEITEEELQAKGEAIKLATINKFNEFAKEALKKVSIDEKTRDSFWKQIENYWDINWLFYPYENDDYETAYKEIEPLMAALKNQRVIKNDPDFVEAGRKCSLDGQNNALFRGQGTTNKLLKKQAVEVNNTWLNPNEGLSAISLVKRAYSGGDEFKSTIEVALKKQVEKVDKSVIDCYEQLFSDDYQQACVQLLIDGVISRIKFNEESKKEDWVTTFDKEFLVADNLTEKNIPNLTQLEIVREVHSKHLKSALTDRYYALIAFDGDKMGKLLSGELLQDKNNIKLEDFQGKVSELLMKYSQEIDKSLSKEIDIVYAGGDDFLGFVCLHDLFEVGKTLREEFKKKVNDELQEEYPLTQEFTFSMGITIAHYKTPLSIVLQTTREMEKLAKNEEKGNRDAFAIAVLKHSGESHEAYYKWDNNFEKWTALKNLVKHLQNDCSETFIRVLEREFRLLQNKKGEIENTNMLTLELGRLAQRSLNEKGRHEKKGRDVTENVIKLISVRESKTQKSYANFTNSFEAMKVAMFMKRKSKAFKKENV